MAGVTVPAQAPADLVVVPGLGLAGEAYAGFAAALAGADVHCRPLPGYGLPAARTTDLSPPALARRLLAAGLVGGGPVAGGPVDSSPVGDRSGAAPAPVVLLGHSASCQVVTELAAMAPERVAALVLVGPTTDPRAATWPRLVGRWLATAASERPGQVPTLARVYARTGLGSMRRGMGDARRHRIQDVVPRVRCPVLVVRGRRDRIAPVDWVRSLARQAGGIAVTLPAGAHMVPLTHPRLLAAAVQEWLVQRAVTPPAP